MKYQSFSYCLLLAVLLTLSGCSEEKVYRIGVSQCSQDDWRTKMNDEIHREIMFHEDAVVDTLCRRQQPQADRRHTIFCRQRI